MSTRTPLSGFGWRAFEWRVFGVALACVAALLLAVVAVPQWLSRQARLDELRAHVGEVARLAAASIDGDAHRRLLDRNNFSQALYDQTVAPLVKLHSVDAGIHYAYTMVEQDGEAYFILDTATSPQLHTRRKLQASGYYEHFALRPEYRSDWLTRIAAGETWVTPDFQHDDYGDFLSGHAPIYDSQGRYSGFVGVDFDTRYFRDQERRFNTILVWSAAAAVVLSILIAYGMARYHYQWQSRLALHYETAMRDELTQLLNRRGAYEAVEVLRHGRSPSYALLLIDVDDFKQINDTRGHALGDEVLVNAAHAIRDSMRSGDVVARIGGDEFLVFAQNCDESAARIVAARIQERVAEQNDLDQAYTLTIGICVARPEASDFDEMYRRADEAMYRAKGAGKNRFEVFSEDERSSVERVS